jgi:hypothetical protein
LMRRCVRMLGLAEGHRPEIKNLAVPGFRFKIVFIGHILHIKTRKGRKNRNPRKS